MELNLLKYNQHWVKNFKYPFLKKREIFEQLLKSLSQKHIVELTGLRRTGKTTLFFQLINHLLQKKVNPFCIWYFTFDEEKLSLEKLLEEFSKQTQIDYKKAKIYIFFDEIQKLPNFQNQLKVYYDLYPNLKFFISGSLSIFIRKKSQESLAGRTIDFFLRPLSFNEYLYFKNRQELFEKPLLYKSELEKEFELFLESQFIESLEMNQEERKRYFVSIIKKIVFEDIPQVFSVNNPEILFQIVKAIGQNPGIFINYQNFSQEMGISNKTISSYLFYLEESFLIKRVFNFSRNLITSEKKLKKFYLASPSFSWALADFVNQGKLVENFVLSLKDYRFFWRDVYKHEVDFIEVEDNEIRPVEVKYKENILSRDFKNLFFFSRKFKLNKVALINKSVEVKDEKIDNFSVQKIPVYFLDFKSEEDKFSS